MGAEAGEWLAGAASGGDEPLLPGLRMPVGAAVRIRGGLSREEALAEPKDGPWAVISLLDPGSAPPTFPDPYPVGALAFQFHDVDDRHQAFIEQYALRPFTAAMANETVLFVDAVAPWIDLLIVHCEVGVSRSAGMGLALAEAYGGDPAWYHQHKAPNGLVYRLMREALRRVPTSLGSR